MTFATKTSAIRNAALAAIVTAAALPAAAMDRDPSDLVPSFISESQFNAMSEAEIYEIDQAQETGNRVVIEGYTASESRELVDAALAART